MTKYKKITKLELQMLVVSTFSDME